MRAEPRRTEDGLLTSLSDLVHLCKNEKEWQCQYEAFKEGRLELCALTLASAAS